MYIEKKCCKDFIEMGESVVRDFFYKYINTNSTDFT